MIYMGLVADNLNYRDGHTVYNDWKMDGLKYSNVGDIVVINPKDVVKVIGDMICSRMVMLDCWILII